MSSNELRQRFLNFFAKRGHSIIPSASLVPENDPSVLFTTAGMQPLVPYLLGESHPKGRRLANVQKCVRTQDIDEVGDNTHDTFFEMLGNWSLGDYFKDDAIRWSYEFLTSKSEGLGLDPRRLYVTVFGGNSDAPKDTESHEVWRSLGILENHIYWMEGPLAKKNWWSPGDNGPCGPDTEMFYDVAGNLDLESREAFLAADARQEVIEVWNDVFMEYEKKDGKVVGKLKQKNVDTGAGLERLAMVMQGENSVFNTDLFNPIMEVIKHNVLSHDDKKGMRIIADHIRTAVFLAVDGVEPSSGERGYVLRRLLRRARYYYSSLGARQKTLRELASSVAQSYRQTSYLSPEALSRAENIITEEENKFLVTLESGRKILEKEIQNLRKEDIAIFPTQSVFLLYTTHGYPAELTKEILIENGMTLPLDFDEEYKKLNRKHQELSRVGAEQKFKGGLANANLKTVMLHTATHLMLAGLRKHLGAHVHQAGSNITEERTRFDFNHPEKVPPAILREVEAYVNEAIAKGCTVAIEKMPKADAQAQGVEGSFWEKYPDTVNVYTVQAGGTVYSRELCGGPHVENTGAIAGRFRIVKEESVSAGIRRIKAVIE